MEVLGSAPRHGVGPEDVQHVVRYALVVEEIADDPLRYLVLGVRTGPGTSLSWS